MAWLYVLLAAVVEIFWVIGLRYSDSTLEWIGTVVAIIISFYAIIKACEKLPAGTVYAVFTGSGAAAIVIIDFVMFHAEFTMMKVLFIAIIITGVIGIKMTTGEKETAEGGE
ncbi:DMT family transporter [Sporosarcina saromensis]|uniref:Multidrug efflux SMR transporter n=1 Tax=Sporosarcina saromensis TaxID=359365 RepID=A0ABU4GEV9_9BACL|nr:multidrug efflux SMR transporter [Sporosarcina saromensis]MDW0114850.1 multidrug efflux SMR transporter [Sporosarcina saromensis]